RWRRGDSRYRRCEEAVTPSGTARRIAAPDTRLEWPPRASVGGAEVRTEEDRSRPAWKPTPVPVQLDSQAGTTAKGSGYFGGNSAEAPPTRRIGGPRALRPPSPRSRPQVRTRPPAIQSSSGPLPDPSSEPTASRYRRTPRRV